jgi:hypothetical protein
MMPHSQAESQVRTGLSAGGKEIRTVGPAVKEKPFRRAILPLTVKLHLLFRKRRAEMEGRAGAALARLTMA